VFDGRRRVYGDLGGLPLLTSSTTLPRIILQGKFEPQTFQAFALNNLGLDNETIDVTPPLEGLIPDLIVARAARGER